MQGFHEKIRGPGQRRCWRAAECNGHDWKMISSAAPNAVQPQRWSLQRWRRSRAAPACPQLPRFETGRLDRQRSATEIHEADHDDDDADRSRSDRRSSADKRCRAPRPSRTIREPSRPRRRWGRRKSCPRPAPADHRLLQRGLGDGVAEGHCDQGRKHVAHDGAMRGDCARAEFWGLKCQALNGLRTNICQTPSTSVSAERSEGEREMREDEWLVT